MFALGYLFRAREGGGVTSKLPWGIAYVSVNYRQM